MLSSCTRRSAAAAAANRSSGPQSKDSGVRGDANLLAAAVASSSSSASSRETLLEHEDEEGASYSSAGANTSGHSCANSNRAPFAMHQHQHQHTKQQSPLVDQNNNSSHNNYQMHGGQFVSSDGSIFTLVNSTTGSCNNSTHTDSDEQRRYLRQAKKQTTAAANQHQHHHQQHQQHAKPAAASLVRNQDQHRRLQYQVHQQLERIYGNKLQEFESQNSRQQPKATVTTVGAAPVASVSMLARDCGNGGVQQLAMGGGGGSKKAINTVESKKSVQAHHYLCRAPIKPTTMLQQQQQQQHYHLHNHQQHQHLERTYDSLNSLPVSERQQQPQMRHQNLEREEDFYELQAHSSRQYSPPPPLPVCNIAEQCNGHLLDAQSLGRGDGDEYNDCDEEEEDEFLLMPEERPQTGGGASGKRTGCREREKQLESLHYATATAAALLNATANAAAALAATTHENQFRSSQQQRRGIEENNQTRRHVASVQVAPYTSGGAIYSENYQELPTSSARQRPRAAPTASGRVAASIGPAAAAPPPPKDSRHQQQQRQGARQVVAQRAPIYATTIGSDYQLQHHLIPSHSVEQLARRPQVPVPVPMPPHQASIHQNGGRQVINLEANKQSQLQQHQHQQQQQKQVLYHIRPKANTGGAERQLYLPLNQVPRATTQTRPPLNAFARHQIELFRQQQLFRHQNPHQMHTQHHNLRHQHQAPTGGVKTMPTQALALPGSGGVGHSGMPALAILHHGGGGKGTSMNVDLIGSIASGENNSTRQNQQQKRFIAIVNSHYAAAAATAAATKEFINRANDLKIVPTQQVNTTGGGGLIYGILTDKKDDKQRQQQSFYGAPRPLLQAITSAPSETSVNSNLPLVFDKNAIKTRLTVIERICRIDLTLFWWSLLAVCLFFIGSMITILRYIPLT